MSLHIADITMFYAPASGGVRTFLEAKADWLRAHPDFRHSLLVPGDERRQTMDLTTRLIEHDNWLAERLIDVAGALDDSALDEPVAVNPPTDSFAEDSPTIRSMLNRVVFTKEMWSAAISGREFVESDETSLAALRKRLAQAGAEFASLVEDIARRNAWDTAFVDATCDPPETFTSAVPSRTS